MARRRNQAPVGSPRLLARFLHHACEVEGVTQADFVKRAGNAVSPATVSRLFRGEVAPTARDLESFADFLAIPLETLQALRMLEAITDQRMLAATGLTSYMVAGRTTCLLLAGFTMGLGVGHLRSARSLVGKTILIDVLEPAELERIEDQITGWAAGDAAASWVSVARTIARLGSFHEEARLRLWVRSSEHVDVEQDFPTGELVANDWFAMEAPPPYKTAPFRVHFYGDTRWTSFIAPLMKRLSVEAHFNHHDLVWDSSDPATDDRFRAMLSRTARRVADLQVRRTTDGFGTDRSVAR